MWQILAALSAAMLAACSTVPPAQYPRYSDLHITAQFTLQEDAARKVPVPESNALVTVFSLTSEPGAVGEEFVAGRRYLLAPPECRHIVVHCHLRAYAQADGHLPTPVELFPGAATLQTDAGPDAP
jgi:hypothetical protein